MLDLFNRYAFSPDHQRTVTRLAYALYLAIIVLGSIPGARSDVGEYASGWLLHSTAYGVITFLLFTGAHGTRLRRALKALLTIAVMGGIDEFIQSFLPYRHGYIGDWIVDMASALLVCACLALVWARLRIRQADAVPKSRKEFVNMQAEKR